MAFIKQEVVVNKKCSYDTAMDHTGFGIYNIIMLTSCCLIILAMYMDIFGFSVVMPAVACDMDLTTAEQGLLSAIPLIGVMFSSYVWGFCADTKGRRTTLLLAMPVGSIFGFAASMAPSYISLAILKFLSASFTSSANAAAFVLVGESTPKRHRSRFMFLLASATMCVQFIICSFALPVFKHSFYIEISWLHMEYRPWRMLMQIISIPGVLGTIAMAFLNESPKFLLSRNQTVKALDTLKSIYRWNTGRKPYTYPVSSVYLDEEPVLVENSSFFRKMWDQTAPLFKPPLLKNSLMLYYILMCAYMTSTGYTMWVPTMTNAYFSGGDKNGLTFCEVASNAASATNSTLKDCDNIIQPITLYAVMCYSGVSTVSSVLLSFAVGPLGKKLTTLLVFAVAAFCGVLLLFVRVPMLSIALFFLFLYVALILGNVNSYLVEWNPTHLRGMATCLSVVVARGFGFISVQLIASLLTDYCTPMISGYVLLVISGFVVAIFLPPERKPVSQSDEEKPIDQ